jgi:hypothetical protein
VPVLYAWPASGWDGGRMFCPSKRRFDNIPS